MNAIARRWVTRTSVVALIVGMLLAVPIAVVASHRFTDVPTTHQFHTDISAVADAGVSAGCDTSPPKYCPEAVVTRGQMAAFMNRLGALRPGQRPVVNADRLDGHDAGDFAELATSAKAAILVQCGTGAAISRSFNNLSSTATTASFTTTGGGAIQTACIIDFKFPIFDRYWTATANSATPVFVTCAAFNSTSLYCKRWRHDGVFEQGLVSVVIH